MLFAEFISPARQEVMRMSVKPTPINGPLHDYLLAVSLREPEILRQLRQETARHPLAQMQVAPEQGFQRHIIGAPDKLTPEDYPNS